MLNGNAKPFLVTDMERRYGPEKILTNVKEVSEGMQGMTASIGVNNDGSVIAWGDNYFWKVSNARNIFPVKTVASGAEHLVCLKEDGTVVVTGRLGFDKYRFPEGLKNVKDIAAGDYHAVVLNEEGTVSVWENSMFGLCTVPKGLDRVVAIDSGRSHVVILHLKKSLEEKVLSGLLKRMDSIQYILG